MGNITFSSSESLSLPVLQQTTEGQDISFVTNSHTSKYGSIFKMDDLAHLERLRLEEEKVLRENEHSQEHRKKIRDDYIKLQERLKTLPDTLTQPTMVPIGEVGFFPGRLVHTNEIMVLLGDNWFVERSAKQAADIVSRRVQLVDSQLSDLQKEHKNIKSHLQFTHEFNQVKQEHDGVMEIKESLPDDVWQKGKSRKAHKAKHNLVQRSVKFKSGDELVTDLNADLNELGASKNNTDSTINHKELLERLNQLEKEEQEEEERQHNQRMDDILNGSQEKDSSDTRQPTTTNNKEKSSLDSEKQFQKAHSLDSILDKPSVTTERHVQFESDLENVDPIDHVNVVDDNGDDNDKEMNEIKFIHTDHVQLQRGRSASESDVLVKQKFNSPADIWEQFCSKQDSDLDGPPLRSILKKDSRSNSNENLKLKPILKTSPEHRPGTPEHYIDDPKPILKTPPDTQSSDRRPGTPEYVLDDDVRPILKSQIPQTSQVDGGSSMPEYVVLDEPVPILKSNNESIISHKTAEVHFADETENFIVDYNNEETRSILKHQSDASSSYTLSDEEHRGILKQDHRTRLKSPDSSRRHSDTERKPILKHPSNEISYDNNIEKDPPIRPSTHQQELAFSGNIVERNISSNQSHSGFIAHTNQTSAQDVSSQSTKPVSRFKAARSKK